MISEFLFILTGIAAIVYFWCKHNYSHWQRKGIPYIKPKPLIGNMDVVFSMKTSFGLYISDVYNEPTMSTEPVVGVYSLNKPGLVIRAPELIKSVLIKDFYKFSNRYAAADPHGDALGSYNLFFVKNPHWKEIRTKLTPVFTSGKIKQMYPLMLEIAKDLETHLGTYEKEENGFTTEVKEICSLFTTDLIATIAFGLRANSLKNPNAEFRQHGRKQFEFTISRAMEFFVAFFLPKLVSLLRVKVFSKEFSKFLRDTINYVMSERERNATTRNDLIDILVSLKKEAALEQQGKHYAQNNDFLVAQAAVFLTAGFETSSSTMAFALFELAKRPDLQQRLRKEICEALLAEKGCLSYDKINSLEYLGMVLDEVLRLYPVLPFLDREYISTKGEPEYTLKPYYDCELSPGTPVFIPIFALQRDTKYWHNPNVFDPERFSSENKKLIQPMTYLPFGTGPRNCIGTRIGLLQAKIGLVHIFKNHYVMPCEKTMHEPVFDPLAFILQCKNGIHLTIVNDRKYEIEAKTQ